MKRNSTENRLKIKQGKSPFLYQGLLGLCLFLSVQTAFAQNAQTNHFVSESEKTPYTQWAGKKVAFLGDSMTDKRTLGPQVSLYWEYLRDLLALCDTYVYGISGHQWDRIYGQAEKLWAEHRDSVDAVLIFAGTNDYNHGIPIGEFFEEENLTIEVRGPQMAERLHRKPIFCDSTFCGRLNKALYYLKEHYPHQQIVMMTPIHRGYAKFNASNVQPDESYANALGLYLETYVETMKRAAAYWSVPVIDLYAMSGIVPNLPSQDVYIAKPLNDRLHPSTEGQYRIAKLLQYQLPALPVRF